MNRNTNPERITLNIAWAILFLYIIYVAYDAYSINKRPKDKAESLQNNKVIGTGCTIGRSLINVTLIKCKNVEVGNSSGFKNEPIEIQSDTNANYTYTINGWKRVGLK